MLRDSSWMLAALAAKSVLQLVAFVLLARQLGPQAFGTFSSALALAALLSPLVELGGYSLIVRDVSRQVPPARALGNSLIVLLTNVPLGLLIVLGVAFVALPGVPWTTLLLVALAELLFTRVIVLVNAVFVAQSALWCNAVIEVVGGVVRLALVVYLARTGGDLGAWVGLYLLQTALLSVGALVWAARLTGRPVGRWREWRDRLGPGVHFAVGGMAQNAYTDLDKAMLPRLADLGAAGIYNSAFRFVMVAFLPLSALLGALYPRFFEAGREGYPAARRLALRTMPLTAGYGLLAGAALLLGAAWLPALLGPGFAETAPALRWLAALLLIQGLYAPFADALTGSGLQRLRTTGQVGALLLNALLNFWLIPRYGWLGAVWSSLISQSFLLLVWGLYYGLRPPVATT